MTLPAGPCGRGPVVFSPPSLLKGPSMGDRNCTTGAVIAAFIIALGSAGCADFKKKDDDEAARNTFACELDGERLIIKFDVGEARLLLPGGERTVLYQITAASGIRYSNGYLELRGKGMDLQLIRDSVVTRLEACAPYVPPAKVS
jgi:membrane-bound inhibitor of C-type lysozyme